MLARFHAQVVAWLDRSLIDRDVAVSCTGAACLVIRFGTSEVEDSGAISEEHAIAVVSEVLIPQVSETSVLVYWLFRIWSAGEGVTARRAVPVSVR